jgi:hypothetical protein
LSSHRLAAPAAVLALLTVFGGMLLPTEHVHYAHGHHGAAVVHRHFSIDPSPTTSHVEDHEGQMQDLRDAWVVRRPFVLSPLLMPAIAAWNVSAAPIRREAVVLDVLHPANGPPSRAHIVRGPPLSA